MELSYNYLPTNFFIFITEGELHIEVIHVWIEDEGEGININDVSYSVFYYTSVSCSLYNKSQTVNYYRLGACYRERI